MISEVDQEDIVQSEWSNRIYPCTNKQCDFIGLLDAFKFGSCYDPCPKCGSPRTKFGKTGRFVYERTVGKWFGLRRSTLKFIGVEWRCKAHVEMRYGKGKSR